MSNENLRPSPHPEVLKMRRILEACGVTKMLIGAGSTRGAFGMDWGYLSVERDTEIMWSKTKWFDLPSDKPFKQDITAATEDEEHSFSPSFTSGGTRYTLLKYLVFEDAIKYEVSILGRNQTNPEARIMTPDEILSIVE